MCDNEQVVRDILFTFQSNVEIETFDVIFQPSATNKSPVLHVQQNLGIESWCVKNLYIYVHQKLFAETSELKNKITQLTTALLLNPHVKTFWNMRREMVLSGVLSLDSELRFISVVLSYKPKVLDAYNYRKWLYREIFKKRTIVPNVHNEFALIQKAADKHPNNHVAWDYCIWFLNHFCSSSNIMFEFWKLSESYISRHVSDYSGLHFRQHVIRVLIENLASINSSLKTETAEISLNYISKMFDVHRDKMHVKNSELLNAIGIVLHDLILNENLICFYPNHEALWNHRRFLCYYFVKVIPSLCGNDEKLFVTRLVFENISNEEEANEFINVWKNIFLQIHKSFVCKVVADEFFLGKYNKWLKNSLNFNS